MLKYQNKTTGQYILKQNVFITCIIIYLPCMEGKRITKGMALGWDAVN